MASPDKHYLDSIMEGQYTGELPGNQRSFKMQNMSLQTIDLVDASLPLALPPVSTASYRNTLGDKLCQPCLGEDTAQRKEAMSLGAMVSDWSWGSGRVSQRQATSPKSWEKAFYMSLAFVTEDRLSNAQQLPAAFL